MYTVIAHKIIIRKYSSWVFLFVHQKIALHKNNNNKKYFKTQTLAYTIMGKTADFTVLQTTLHEEGKPQTVNSEDAGCLPSDVFNHNRQLS